MQKNHIASYEENPPLSPVERLREQFQGTYNLIVHHEWMIDLLNSKLTLEQFEAFVSQESYIYDFLAKKLVSLAMESSNEDYDDLMKVGYFFYAEGYDNRKPLDMSQGLLLSCPTQEYIATLNRIWCASPSTNDIQRLLTVLSILWIREDLYRLLNSEPYHSKFNVWTDRMAKVNPQEHVHIISKMTHQAFEGLLRKDDKSRIEVQQELEAMLSSLMQFELLIRNHAYQITFNQPQQL